MDLPERGGEGRGSLPRVLLAPRGDPAAQNICRHLLRLYPFRPWGRAYRLGEFALLPVEEDPLTLTSLPLPASEVLVLSRHASASGLPTLSVHAPGKPEEGRLALAKPETVGSLLRALQLAKEEGDLPHRVCLEATHHGPVDLEVPVTFVEIGSGKEEWTKEEAGKAVAKAVLSPLEEGLRAVGVGGPHYAPRHTEAVLRTRYWVGHLLPKYVTLTRELLEEAIRRTQGGAGLILSDEEGMNSRQKGIVEETSVRLGIPRVSVKQALSQKL
jgi:D-aminoacyl-tRNA deacylase